MRRLLPLTFVTLAAAFATLNCAGSGEGITRFAYLLVNPTTLRALNLESGELAGGTVTLLTPMHNIVYVSTGRKLLGYTGGRLWSIDPQTGTCTSITTTAFKAPAEAGLAVVPGTTTIRIIDAGQTNFDVSSVTGQIVNTFTATNIPGFSLGVRASTNEWFAQSAGGSLYRSTNIDSGVFALFGPAFGTQGLAVQGLTVDDLTDRGYVTTSSGVKQFDLNTGVITDLNSIVAIDIDLIE